MNPVMMSGTVTAKLRAYFSLQHIRSAATFTREAQAIEKEHGTSTFNDDVFADHRGRVLAAIFSSVAFLEGSINELFMDTTDTTSERLKTFDPDVRRSMADSWAKGVPRTAKYRVAQKFDIALSLAGKAPLESGHAPYQDVVALVRVRNALIHFEPEWSPASTPNRGGAIHEFEQSLKGKFPPNPLTGAGNPFWPDKCLSHGCAAWGVESCIAFADKFFARIGLPAPYDHLRGTLGVT